MSIAFVQANGGAEGSPVTSFSVAYTSNVTAGNFLVAFCQPSGTTVTSVTDTLGNGPSGSWKLAGSFTTWYGVNFDIYYAWGVSGGANTVTVHYAGTDASGSLLIGEYSGVLATGDPFDVSAVASGNSALANSGSATTTAFGDLLVGWFTAGGSLNTNAHGFTNRGTWGFANTTTFKDQIAGAAGSYSAEADCASNNWTAVMAAFLPAPPILGRSPRMTPVG